MRNKVLLVLLMILIIPLALVFIGCEEEVAEKPVNMSWGIPDHVTAFEDLQREPQGLEVEHVDEVTLQVTWEKGESYILPISATSDRALPGVRYQGSAIPDHLELEWLDPRQEVWFPLEEIPEERVKVVIEPENDHFLIDFGPPGGADFEEDMTRLIWFRITPTEGDQFEFEIFGYQIEEGSSGEARVSNILTLQAEVIE